MNSIEAFISKHVPLDGLTIKKRNEITVETLRFVFKFVSASQFDARFRNTLGQPVRTIELRRAIMLDGYIMKNIKLWYYFVVSNDLLRKQRAKTAKDFKINEDDIELLKHAVQFKSDFNKLFKQGYKALTLASFEKNMTWQFSNRVINNYLAKFVYRKMRFIIQTQGFEPEDLIQELKAGSVRAVLEKYPRIKDANHCHNILKRCMHNGGANLIEFYSGEKRSKFMRNQDGSFESKIVPISFAVTDESLNDFMSSTLTNSQSDYDQQISVRKVLSKYDGKRKQFLNLLMNHDAEFTKWLQEKKVTRRDNEDYMEVAETKDYIGHALEFLGVKQEVGEKFISQLKKQLGG